MSEDLEKVEQELVEKYGTEKSSVEEEVVETYDEDESQARSNGWDPEKGELSAKEFNMRGEFIGQMRDYQSQIKDLHATVTKMTSGQQQREEAIRQQTISEMESKRREAVESGDVETFNAYDEQIKEYEKVAPAQTVDPEVVAFTERNKSWYNNDSIENYEMSQYAVNVDNFLHTQNPSISKGEALKAVELEVKQRFPERFKNSKQENVAAVASANKESGVRSKDTMSMNDLNPVQKSFYEQAVKGEIPGMSGKEYLKSLKSIEETGKT